MFVVLAYFPLEALDGDELNRGKVEVLKVCEAEGEAEYFMAIYKAAYESACDEWNRWDTGDDPWGESHDKKFDELCQKWGVINQISDMKFEIQEVV